MSANYAYLDLRGTVWQRWVQSVTAYQVNENNQMLNVAAGRLALRVAFNEFAPQIEGVDLDIVAVDIKRDSDGAVIAQYEKDYTL